MRAARTAPRRRRPSTARQQVQREARVGVAAGAARRSAAARSRRRPRRRRRRAGVRRAGAVRRAGTRVAGRDAGPGPTTRAPGRQRAEAQVVASGRGRRTAARPWRSARRRPRRSGARRDPDPGATVPKPSRASRERSSCRFSALRLGHGEHDQQPAVRQARGRVPKMRRSPSRRTLEHRGGEPVAGACRPAGGSAGSRALEPGDRRADGLLARRRARPSAGSGAATGSHPAAAARVEPVDGDDQLARLRVAEAAPRRQRARGSASPSP